MKYTNKCPRCGSREIFMMDSARQEDSKQHGMAANNVYYSNVSVQQYICCQCGYSEEWVDRFSIAGISRPHTIFPLNK